MDAIIGREGLTILRQTLLVSGPGHGHIRDIAMRRHLPNMLTLFRIAVIPVFVAVYYLPGPLGPWLVLGLFLAAAVTDYFDGYLARRFAVESALGRFLDPIADKLLVAAALLLLAGDDRAPVIAALIIILRELSISGLREFLAGDDVIVPVSPLAKWKTASQLVAIGLLLLAGTGWGNASIQAFGAWGLWLAAALSVITAAGYMRAGFARLVTGDAGEV